MGAPSGYSFYYQGGGSGNGGGDGGAFSSGAGGGGCTNNVSAVDAKGGNYGGVGGKANRSGGGSGQGGWGGEGNPAGGVTGNTGGYGGPGFNGCAGIVWLVVNGDITFGVDGQVDCSGTDGHSGVTWVAHDGPSGGGAAFVLYSGSAPAPNINVSGGRGPEVANWRYGGKYDAQVSPKNTTGGMTLISNAQTAQADPTTGRLIVYEEDVDSITLDTDLKGYVSRDGGTTYTQTPLVEDTVYDSQAFNQGGIDSNTGLMLHMDGANDGVIFTDNSDSPHTITVGGNTHTDTAVKKFGTASAQFDGTGDYLSAPDSSDWSIFANTSDSKTLDFWVNHTVVSSGQVYFMPREAGTDYWFIRHDSPNILLYGKIGDSVFINQTASAFSNTGAWHHIALVKIANVVAVYVDGTQIIYTTFSTTKDFAAPLTIGSQDGTSDFFNGYMDEVRWSNSNPFSATPNSTPDDTITVPTAAYSTGAAATAYTKRLVSGSVDISGQPAGSDMKYKIETLNDKNLKLHGASLLWA
jgi:hypothetical protein